MQLERLIALPITCLNLRGKEFYILHQFVIMMSSLKLMEGGFLPSESLLLIGQTLAK
jgi:hypothetical protein